MANSPMGQKDRSYNNRLSVQNVDTAVILPGTPVSYPMNLTADGYGVQLPSTVGTALATPFFVGFAADNNPAGVPVGGWFDVIPQGFVPFIRLIRGTRAATTAAWPTFPAINIGDSLQINTVFNAVSLSGTGAANESPIMIVCAGLTGATASAALTAASVTTAASNAYTAFSAATGYTVGIRGLVRALA